MIRPRGLGAGALVVLLLTAGCLGQLPGNGETTPAREPIDQAKEEPGTRLTVEVLDIARVPIQGADVTLLGQGTAATRSTDAVGQAGFTALEPGRVTLDVRAAGHQERRVTTSVADGHAVTETVVLPPLQANQTFVQRFEFEGFFECSATYLIITGGCQAPVEAVAGEAGVPYNASGTNARYTFPFELGSGWTRLAIAQTWQEPVAGLGSMMRVNLEPIDKNNTDGHGQRFARADGSSPLQLTVENDGQPAATASSEEMILPEEGGLARTRTFHLGFEQAHRPGGTGFLGAGAAIQQQFTVYVNVTYGS